MAKLIPLTQGQFAIVDDEDFEWLSRFNWMLQTHSKTRHRYARREELAPELGSLPSGKTRRRAILMHREIIAAGDYNARRTPVDHKDGDGLNNQKDNLRVSDCTLNNANRGPTKNNKSGFKGVCAVGNRWRAAIQVRGERISLGNYETPEEAHAAYCAAAIKYFGEFARSS